MDTQEIESFIKAVGGLTDEQKELFIKWLDTKFADSNTQSNN